MTSLSASDPHYWAPVPQVLAKLEHQYSGGRVLDVGPGHSPLPWATASVDFVNAPGAINPTICDLTRDPLPFADKSFDLVFCRHLLEDSWNPFPICAEMERVGKAGYIETPSPICELTRGVDGGGSPPYRGYFHHRFIVWVDGDDLRFVSKYPLVEHLSFSDGEEALAQALRSGPKYWNTYYHWNDRIKWRHLQAPLDFEIMRDYGNVLRDAMEKSAIATNEFWSDIPVETVPSIQRAYA